ncbi:unnamed protein product [Oikopleura dioica]|uniref:Carboxylic ester hydrolase n=1 Tax=Oikopleura dioica TaxID=34765 RepID=E4Y4H2_OIKDI|nr:unnamed protein product [Oikopleura dioica]
MLLLFGVFCLCRLQAFTLEVPVHVKLADGSPIRGKKVKSVNETEIEAYLGIRYAKAPVGEKRFAQPEPVDSWSSQYNATRFGNSCWQTNDDTYGEFKGSAMWNPNTKKDEDCLFLNVWTSGKTQKKAIWIYGGSFNSGTASLEVYDGRVLASLGDVVVVSLNYRLGPFGFMPRLDDSVSDNAGLLDQRLAMQWVKTNIHKFGGDPDNVTIFGESAGGASVGMHLISPKSWPLFNRAVMQSGSTMSNWASATEELAFSKTLELGRKAGIQSCDISSATDRRRFLASLRQLDAQTLTDSQWVDSADEIFEFSFVPVIGKTGDTLPGDPKELFREGKFKKTDIIFGWNKNEGSWFNTYVLEGFDVNTDSLVSPDSYERNLYKCGLGLDKVGLASVAFEYAPWDNPADKAGYRDALDEIVAHKHVTCPGIELLQNVAKFRDLRAYGYQLDSIISSNPWPKWMGVMHGYEIEYVFGTILLQDQGFYPMVKFNPEEFVLTKRMIQYWTNFAKTGSPMGNSSSNKKYQLKNLPLWETFDSEFNRYLILDQVSNQTMLKSGILPHHRKCEFWTRQIPELKRLTSSISDDMTAWKDDLGRWNSAMNRWEDAFDKFSRGRRNRE